MFHTPEPPAPTRPSHRINVPLSIHGMPRRPSSPNGSGRSHGDSEAGMSPLSSPQSFTTLSSPRDRHGHLSTTSTLVGSPQATPALPSAPKSATFREPETHTCHCKRKVSQIPERPEWTPPPRAVAPIATASANQAATAEDVRSPSSISRFAHRIKAALCMPKRGDRQQPGERDDWLRDEREDDVEKVVGRHWSEY